MGKVQTVIRYIDKMLIVWACKSLSCALRNLLRSIFLCYFKSLGSFNKMAHQLSYSSFEMILVSTFVDLFFINVHFGSVWECSSWQILLSWSILMKILLKIWEDLIKKLSKAIVLNNFHWLLRFTDKPSS